MLTEIPVPKILSVLSSGYPWFATESFRYHQGPHIFRNFYPAISYNDSNLYHLPL